MFNIFLRKKHFLSHSLATLIPLLREKKNPQRFVRITKILNVCLFKYIKKGNRFHGMYLLFLTIIHMHFYVSLIILRDA